MIRRPKPDAEDIINIRGNGDGRGKTVPPLSYRELMKAHTWI
jgi:hypothetical protein